MQKEKIHIIKIGGNIIDDPEALQHFISKFSAVKSKKILIHGGGKIATVFGEKLGIDSRYVDGRRITDDETIDLVTMVYGGLVNKKIIALLQASGCNAIGLTGADANIIPATKRSNQDIDFGWVGDVNQKIDSKKITLLLENDLTPVFAPLTHDSQGHILNTNADTIASVIATALTDDYEVSLIFCFEKNGVLIDIENEQSVIAEMDEKTYADLKVSKKIFAGILPKLDNAFAALKNGVHHVMLGNATELDELIDGNAGTKFLMR